MIIAGLKGLGFIIWFPLIAPLNYSPKPCEIIIIYLMRNIPTKIRTTITIAIGIHSGAVTHHQDQVIYPVSFKTRKTTNRIVPKLIPPSFILFSIFKVNILISYNTKITLFLVITNLFAVFLHFILFLLY